MTEFEDVFGSAPSASASAPGRVNLLGEHTDYNDGYVLPTAIPQKTYVSVRESHDAWTTVYSAELDLQSRFKQHDPPEAHFARYIYGCILEAAESGARVPPLNIHVRSDVPIGVGLSSSAALEVATLRALRALLSLDLDDLALAKLAQRAEIRYAGVHCGILDQMASSLLEPGCMLFLDTRSLERRLLPLPDSSEFLVIDSGVPRTLATSKYNERRSECETAARKLGVAALRDAPSIRAVEELAEPLKRRARHVICENARVLRAAEGVSAGEFGQLMRDSHRSLRDDYEVSVPAVDVLTGLMQQDPAVFGAKLTGAGFGGACVALCRIDESVAASSRILAAYQRAGYAGRLLVPAPVVKQ